MTTNAAEFSIGLVAPAFPRDPLNVNVYLEHVLLGQIIEPLFTVGEDGLLKGAVAEKWEFDKTRTELRITLRKGLSFSNGKSLTAEDVKFSLDRHITNPTSQSYNYLQVIKDLKVVSSDQVVFHLKHPYVPFLLSLTRDQLGILPKDWTFLPESIEPFIGTGPYRLTKENGQWVLSPNSTYRNPSELEIKRWRVEIMDNAKEKYPVVPPDLTFFIPSPIKQSILKFYPGFLETHNESKTLTFLQYSYWWLKDHYNDYSKEQRIQIKNALLVLAQLIVKTTGGDVSSGIIPPGIPGSLNAVLPSPKSSVVSPLKIKLVVPQALLEIAEKITRNDPLFKSMQVSVEFIPFTHLEASKIKNMDATLVLLGFAGGFFDPEGFLTVLPSFIGRPTSQLFGDAAEAIRLKAEKEFDGKRRADLYREFSTLAQTEIRYIPGFAPHISEFRSHAITKKSTAFKYSYKLTDYKKTSKGGENDN